MAQLPRLGSGSYTRSERHVRDTIQLLRFESMYPSHSRPQISADFAFVWETPGMRRRQASITKTNTPHCVQIWSRKSGAFHLSCVATAASAKIEERRALPRPSVIPDTRSIPSKLKHRMPQWVHELQAANLRKQ